MTTAGVVGRVGGLAVALGAGVVIGLSVAAPASADSDTRGASASDSAPSPQRRGADATAGATAARPGAHRATPRSAASVAAAAGSAAPAGILNPEVPSVTVRAAAVSPSPAPVAAQPAPAAVQPAPAAVASQPASAAASPAPAAATAQPTALTICDPRGRKITVLKGTHFVIPQSWSFFTKKVTGTGTFTPDSVYDLKDVDQYDWNKFTGIAFSPLQHDRNSAMVGWRYNLTTQEFEIAPFYNVNKERVLPNEKTEVISVPADQTFTYTVDYTGITISYGDKTVTKPYPEGLKPTVWTATRVSGWFGGNEVAPRTLSYYLKFTR